MKRWSPILLAVAALALPAEARGGRGRGPEVTETPDGAHVRLQLGDDESAQAWLLREVEPEGEDGTVDLIVAMHGAGGMPRNFLSPRLARDRRAWILAPAGRSTVQTERGTGHMWDTRDAETVVAFVRHLLDAHPIDPERVLVWGLSAGGTMTLEVLAEEPGLFAGGVTTAAPRTPDSRHDEQRVAVFLGTEDPNWAGAPAVRGYVESLARKRRKGACALFAVEGLGHTTPDEAYLSFAFDWVLHGEARGGEATVPSGPPRVEAELQHLLVRYRGSEGAPDDLRRSRGKAKRLVKEIERELARGRAWFPFEACCHSDDRATGPLGGTIEAGDLAAFGVEPPTLAPGEVSGILESPHGYHLVRRRPDDAAAGP